MMREYPRPVLEYRASVHEYRARALCPAKGFFTETMWGLH